MVIAIIIIVMVSNIIRIFKALMMIIMVITIILVITGIKMINIIASSHPHLPVITTQLQQSKSLIRGCENDYWVCIYLFGFICLDIYVWVSVQFCLSLPGVLLPCKKCKKSAQMYVSMLTRSILDSTIHQCIFIS